MSGDSAVVLPGDAFTILPLRAVIVASGIVVAQRLPASVGGGIAA